jgi:phosphoglucosamine mutase
LEVLPQTLVNVRFTTKRPLEELPSVQSAIGRFRDEFGDSGRVVVRFSGTEPLARVMVEGPNAERVVHHARQIAGAIETALSA